MLNSLLALLLVTAAALLTVSSLLDVAENPGLARYCAGGPPPRTWQGTVPPWATPARLDWLCATSALLREELGLKIGDD